MHHGMIPELVGRLPVMIALDTLDQRALVEVLTRPRNALIKQYQQMLKLDNVELALPTMACAPPPTKPSNMAGARGLRTIIERTLADVMYEVPSRRDIRKVVVDAAAIHGQADPAMYDRKAANRSADWCARWQCRHSVELAQARNSRWPLSLFSHFHGRYGV